MTHYFILEGQDTEGPFTIDQLSSKRISYDTPVWYEGLSEWTVAGKLEELKPLLKPATPPPYKSIPPPVVTEEPAKKFKLNSYQIGGLVLLFVISYFFYSGNENSATASVESSPLIDSAAVELTEAQRINAALTEKNKNYRNNWTRFISAKPDDYKSSELGGIYNLEAVVINKTDYVLDEVTVAIKYIKANGGSYKTELVTIYNVPAQGKAAMPAPDSDRGTSIQMNIIGISSGKMNFCYSEEMDGSAGDDPYFCK